jgi:hypothetical protein
MRSAKIMIVASAALALAAIGGCTTPNPSGNPSSGNESNNGSGSTAGTSAPAGTSQPAPAPASSPPASSSSSSSSGSAEPQSSEAAPATTASTTSAGTTPSGSAQTPDERRAAIDRRLDTSLGTFDEELRKEQERVAKERDAREATAASSATSDTETADENEQEGEGEESGSASTENPPVANTDGTDAKSGDSTARPGDLKSDKDRGGTNSGAAAGSGATAQNIPDGSDDDIVARRLRKAAEQETDPELKEKLWKEYIEYKKNAGQ